jgi:hypothetical protein
MAAIPEGKTALLWLGVRLPYSRSIAASNLVRACDVERQYFGPWWVLRPGAGWSKIIVSRFAAIVGGDEIEAKCREYLAV